MSKTYNKHYFETLDREEELKEVANKIHDLRLDVLYWVDRLETLTEKKNDDKW
tara:strand:+ start:681 stop:839 length:159 start_codon:yes stop_codon:yes gene_type:complete